MTPPLSRRALVALATGVLCGLAAWGFMRRPGFTPDVGYPYAEAQAWVAGLDPFRVLRGGGPPPYDYPAVYPLPAALYLAPLAALGLPLPVAGAVVVATFAALLARAWAASGRGDQPHAFLSAPFVLAVSLGQWSPLLLTGALASPVLLGLGMAAKPTVGLAAFAYRPSWRALGVALVAIAASVALLPAWPLEWLDNLRAMPPVQRAPILLPGGLLALAALVKWRTPEARLLLALSCVPHTVYFYDELLLVLCARTRGQSAALALAMTLGWLGWQAVGLTVGQGSSLLGTAPPWVLWGCYAPALLVVLRHPNVAAADDPRTPALAVVRAP